MGIINSNMSSKDEDSFLWDYIYNVPPSQLETPPYYPPPTPEPRYYPPPTSESPTPEPRYYPPPTPEPRYYSPSKNSGSCKRTVDQVTEALAKAGLESSNLILGIDFTESNEWTGKFSFDRKSLHHIGNGPNPYEQAISIIGESIAAFIDPIPCYGFGDASTQDQDVFSFYPDDRKCYGFEEVQRRYREIVPDLRLSGPTSFAPIIEIAMTIVEQSRGQYHVLVIITDGQATRHVDTQHGQLSPQEQKTVEAIVQASKLPLSIIFVGVGDEPFDMIKELPDRAFDNFHIMNLVDHMFKNTSPSQNGAKFALAALISQHKATTELNILGGRKGNVPVRVPLPPPTDAVTSFNSSNPPHPISSTSLRYGSASSSSSNPPHPIGSTSLRCGSASSNSSNPPHRIGFPPSAPPFQEDSRLCNICLSNCKDMAFGCGHMTCEECAEKLQMCPTCRRPIQSKLKLFF